MINYAVDLAQFADYLDACEIHSASELNLDCLRGFLRELSGYGFSKSSITRKLSALRGFVRYLAQSGAIDKDVSVGLKGPRQSSHLPRALAYEDVVRLLDEGTKGNKKELRDSLLLELLYASGLRINEAVSLNWGDVDIPERWLRITGKGSRTRLVPFGRTGQLLLSEWREDCLARACPAEEHFPLFHGVGAERLTERTVHRMVVAAARKVGLFGVTPHTLRHSYATHMLERGAPLRVIQELMGHESLVTTQRYLRITTEQMKNSYIRTHPRSGFGGKSE